tara:strand:+ start:63 stop:539 length:477 start_codon:yes stop_codon:yes gene_type:complete
MTEADFIRRLDKLNKGYATNILNGSKKLLLSRFDKEQDVDGNANFNNAPLRPATNKDRKYKNFREEHPILRRTGGLRDNIEFINNGEGKISITHNFNYAEALNKGKHGKGYPMKPRKFLDFPKEFRESGGKERKKLLDKLIKDTQTLYAVFASEKMRG